jgi:hypothetical protein
VPVSAIPLVSRQAVGRQRRRNPPTHHNASSRTFARPFSASYRRPVLRRTSPKQTIRNSIRAQPPSLCLSRPSMRLSSALRRVGWVVPVNPSLIAVVLIRRSPTIMANFNNSVGLCIHGRHSGAALRRESGDGFVPAKISHRRRFLFSKNRKHAIVSTVRFWPEWVGDRLPGQTDCHSRPPESNSRSRPSVDASEIGGGEIFRLANA